MKNQTKVNQIKDINDIQIGDKVKLLITSHPLYSKTIKSGSIGIAHSIYKMIDTVSINFSGVHRKIHIRFLEIVQKKPKGMSYIYPPQNGSNYVSTKNK